MKDIKIVATFNSGREIEFELSSVVTCMGHQCAEDVSLAEEVGEEMAYLHDNFKDATFRILPL